MSVQVNTYRERTGAGNPALITLPEEQKKALIVEALSDKGFSHSDAAALLNINRSYVSKVSKKQETGLLAPLAKIARKSVKALAKGELVGNMKEIKGSDVLGACNAIIDRAEPKINRSEIKSLHATIDITGEDRDRIIKSLGLLNNAQIIDSGMELVEKQDNPVLITPKNE